MGFYENLNKVLEEKNMTAYSLAKSLGVAYTTVYSWKKSAPSVSIVVSVAELLNCSLDYLVLGKDYNQADRFSNEELEFIKVLRMLPDSYRSALSASALAFLSQVEKEEKTQESSAV